jgi:hypothetical protein
MKNDVALDERETQNNDAIESPPQPPHPSTAPAPARREKVRAKTGRKARKSRRKKGPADHVIVGFDGEWVKAVLKGLHDEPDDPSEIGGNCVICYQWHTIRNSPDGSRDECSGIAYTKGPTKSHRLSLGGFLTRALESARVAGVITKMPDAITLAAHFSRADLSALRDFPRLKKVFDGVRRTFATTNRPVRVPVQTARGRTAWITVTLRDTMLLAPAGKSSLRALGDLLDEPKLTPPPGMIERMDLWLEKDREAFEAYAVQDARIAARYIESMIRFSRETLRLPDQLGPTLGSIGVTIFERLCKANQYPLEKLLGKKTVAVDTFDAATGRTRKKTCAQTTAAYADWAPFFADSYHGGRNEAYTVGYSARGEIADIDIQGAYTAAMAAIRTPDYEAARATTKLNDFLEAGPLSLGVARVRFEFPSDTRFPSLPVRCGDRGLIYPLKGVTFCTTAELITAHDRGARIEIERGVIVPWADDRRPFAEFSADIAKLRASLGKGTMFEQNAKEIGNSLYGKIAQGVADSKVANKSSVGPKRVFNTRKGEMENLPESKITCAALAAFVTGIVRALLSELLAGVPIDRDIYSATTDGLLTSARLDEIPVDGPVARAFADLRKIVSGDPAVLEVKHQAGRVIVIKTRGCISVEPIDPTAPGKPVVARAGVRLAESPENPWHENQALENLYRTRSYETRYTRRQLIALRPQWQAETDMVTIEREVRVNWDFDFKRRLVAVHDSEGLIAAESRPWRTVEEFIEYRDCFERWRSNHSQVLLTMADYNAFEVWRSQAPTRTAGLRARGKPALHKLLLRAIAQRQFGLTYDTYTVTAAELTAAGWPTTAVDLKNAGRRPLVPGALSDVAAEEWGLLAWALARWPEADLTQLFAPGSTGSALADRCHNQCHGVITAYGPIYTVMTPVEIPLSDQTLSVGSNDGVVGTTPSFLTVLGTLNPHLQTPVLQRDVTEIAEWLEKQIATQSSRCTRISDALAGWRWPPLDAARIAHYRELLSYANKTISI